MEIREVRAEDLTGLMELYTELHDNPMPVLEESLQKLWSSILINADHHIIVVTEDDRIVSSCVLMVIRNLTHHQRPYALIENVITSEKYRNRGYATELLQYAKSISVSENCYKIMLLTGSKKDSTLSFYEKAGYNRNDKTAFIQWLP
jgi:ribosomal protein S18 acetylase RimI-like enzyme